jgi:hypothetical protein
VDNKQPHRRPNRRAAVRATGRCRLVRAVDTISVPHGAVLAIATEAPDLLTARKSLPSQTRCSNPTKRREEGDKVI